MGRPIHTRGLVLRRTDWSESSQIVTVDTRDHGIIDLLAKGSRRIARRSSSFAEPLDLGGWYDLVYRPRRADLHLAVEARVRRAPNLAHATVADRLLEVEGSEAEGRSHGKSLSESRNPVGIPRATYLMDRRSSRTLRER